ncbi:MAG TPA: polysaccharide deacetylase family protein [Clostridia bacterium]|nr:polysaccharide deacetylase family protein [Clostridia bacterium]
MLTAITTGVAVAAAASLAGMHTMVPWSQLYGRNFNGLAAGSRRLALTFDDGPNDPHTLRLLEVLERHGARATFFLLGKYVAERPEIARAVVDGRHAVGNHSWDHPNLIFATGAELRRQIERTQRVIEEATGVRPALFRPPFGGRRPGTFAVARRYGLTPVMWRISSYDWEAASVAQIVERVARQVRGGEVILLHDGGHLTMGTDRRLTVEATDEFVRRYKAEGYEFVTVPEMMSE